MSAELDTLQALISHQFSPETIETVVDNLTNKINTSDKSAAEKTNLIDLLHQLSTFDLGKFLLQNRGLNGYWTHYILTFPWFGAKTGLNNQGLPLSKLEKFLLECAPTMLATQERFQIFLRENQKAVKDNAKLAVIPSGMMGELLYLNYENIRHIELIGIDYDKATLNDALNLAEKNKLKQFVRMLQRDAWELNIENEFDLISSNGLNIYEPDPEKIKALYQQFYLALKPGGKLVTSFLTYPPTLTANCEWNMQNINLEHLKLQAIIFKEIIAGKWQCFRSTAETEAQLKAVGFKDIEFFYDKAKIFPTVVGYK